MEVFVCSVCSSRLYMAQFETQHTGVAKAFFTSGTSRNFAVARVNVIRFTFVGKGTASTELIVNGTQKHSTTFCAALLYRTVPKYGNKSGKCGWKETNRFYHLRR